MLSLDNFSLTNPSKLGVRHPITKPYTVLLASHANLKCWKFPLDEQLPLVETFPFQDISLTPESGE